MSLADAVRAYTTGSAAAERAAGRRGSLAVGKDADLVVLSTDSFRLPPDALLQTVAACLEAANRPSSRDAAGKISSGQVTRPTLKSDAERVVKKIEGVSNVVNNIEVLPLSPNDDRIRVAVYRALYAGNSTLFRYSLGAVGSIHIVVENGNVTLAGRVDSEMDKDIANIRANGVSGVFSVTNNLVVVKS